MRLRMNSKWGPWHLRRETLELLYIDARGCQEYAVDLEDCYNSASTLDWVAQVAEKSWVSSADIGDLVLALNDVIGLQQNICGFSKDHQIDPVKVIRGRLNPTSSGCLADPRDTAHCTNDENGVATAISDRLCLPDPTTPLLADCTREDFTRNPKLAKEARVVLDMTAHSWEDQYIWSGWELGCYMDDYQDAQENPYLTPKQAARQEARAEKMLAENYELYFGNMPDQPPK